MKKETKKRDEDSKLFAFLATFLSIVGFIIALIAKKNNKYVMHYAKQSLVIFIIFIISAAIKVIPFIGKVASVIVYVIAFIFWLFSWIYALSGKMKEIPFVSQYSEKINL